MGSYSRVGSGKCGPYSGLSPLPYIQDSRMDESAVKSKCQSSAGCIGYAYRSYSYDSIVYFNSQNAARSAATNGWRLDSSISQSCPYTCRIGTTRSGYLYSCYSANNVYTVAPTGNPSLGREPAMGANQVVGLSVVFGAMPWFLLGVWHCCCRKKGCCLALR